MFDNIMQRVDHFIDRVSQFLLTLSGIMLVIMALAAAYGVIRRYVIKSPEPFSYEISLIFMLWSFVFAISAVEMNNGHVRVDFISNLLPNNMQNILLNIIVPLLGLFTISILTWQSWLDAMVSLRFGEVSSSKWGEPLFPIKIFVPICYGFLCVVLLIKLYKGFTYKATQSKNNINENDKTLAKTPEI